ncbi:MAG TPA: gephyrin-like molybdotransferase Glp [Mycobacteriales bacterium]|nr:gephyrin-like molybdotransferase Glp [Mycobacteriales bacterium]
MKPVDEHLAGILAVVGPLGDFEVSLLDAHGCLLTEDVVAPHPLPAFDNSAMDGYAVRVADVREASPATPVTLPVVGDIPAGSVAPFRIQRGFTARIMTGAPVPAGAEAVVPLEWTDGGLAQVRIEQAPRPGQHIRRAGEDVVAGTTVLRAGTYLGAAQLGLLAAVGHARVRVRPRPRVVVVSTGAELVEPGTATDVGQITDSNSYTLTAAVREAGGIAYRVGIVPDDPRTLLSALEDQLIRADVLVTTGGVSVGAYDVVKEVLSRLGTVTFDRVAMQPGMPQGFGTIGPDNTPIFALPGNAVSAFVSFEVFVRPALRRMLGAQPITRPAVRAALAAPITSPNGKRSYARGVVEARDGGYVVTPQTGQGSHQLAALAAANCLVVVPETVTALDIGDEVEVLLLERRRL